MTTTTDTAQALTFTVSEPDLRDALTAALLSASSDYTLPVLCAVKLERKGDRMIVTSTDRYRLTRVTITPTENMNNQPGDDWTVLVDAKDVKRIVASLQKRPSRYSESVMPVTLTVEPGTSDDTLTVATLGGRTAARSLHRDWTFPKVDPILEAHDAEARDALAFNPRYMTDLCKMPGRGRNESVTVQVESGKNKDAPSSRLRSTWKDGANAYEHVLMLVRTESA